MILSRSLQAMSTTLRVGVSRVGGSARKVIVGFGTPALGTSRSMDSTSMLKADHRAVEQLFKRFERA